VLKRPQEQICSGLGYEISHKLIGYVQWNVMRDTIIDFFSDRNVKLNDTLLFYYSGHGILDIDGEVYISTSQTDRDMPEKKGFWVKAINEDGRFGEWTWDVAFKQSDVKGILAKIVKIRSLIK
jgi:hypothetical protein